VGVVEEPAGFHFAWTDNQVADELRSRVKKTRFVQVTSGHKKSGGGLGPGAATDSKDVEAGEVRADADKSSVLSGQESRQELVAIIEAALAALEALEEEAAQEVMQ